MSKYTPSVTRSTNDLRNLERHETALDFVARRLQNGKTMKTKMEKFGLIRKRTCCSKNQRVSIFVNFAVVFLGSDNRETSFGYWLPELAIVWKIALWLSHSSKRSYPLLSVPNTPAKMLKLPLKSAADTLRFGVVGCWNRLENTNFIFDWIFLIIVKKFDYWKKRFIFTKIYTIFTTRCKDTVIIFDLSRGSSKKNKLFLKFF